MGGSRVGALVAATAGVAFILVNAGSLTDQAAIVVRVVGGVAGVGVIARVLTRREPGAQDASPALAAWRVYWTMVAFEVVLLVVGSRVLVSSGHKELATPWVALVVGLHFLPFARAFGTPMFRWLGWALIALGVVGGLAAALVGESVGAVSAGVGSGVVLLVFAALFNTGRHTFALGS